MTDSTGEVFIYRVDSINVTTWKTVTVDLTKAPVSSAGGNADKVLDGPIALTKIYLTRNGSQPPTGTVLLDNIRVVGDGWSVPASSRSYFTPSNGESTSFTFSAGSVGDYALQLKDSSGRVRVLSGTVSAAGTQSVDWDGKDAGGSQLLGVVNAVLSYDSVPDGVLAAQPVSGGVVGITTVAEPVGAAALLLDFEDSGASWKKTAGSVTLGGSTSRTQGATSLSLAYDVSGGPAEIRPVATPISAPMNAFSALKVDLKGDGTWNTVYLNVTDATGEVFNYRVDSMNVTTWKTVSVDLTVAPSTTSGGNADKVLDAPIAVTKIYLTRNGTQPATGTIFLDNIRAVGDGWTSPTSVNPNNQDNFVPSAGQSTEVRFSSATSGDYELVVYDSTGLSRTFRGTAASPGMISLIWDGRSDSGTVMAGSISGRLSNDTSADGTLSTTSRSIGVTPYLTGIAARIEDPNNPSLVGVSADIAYAALPVDANARAKLAEDAFVHYDREEFGWDTIEPSKGYFTWGRSDQTVAAATARNLAIVGRLGFSAHWASSAPVGTPEADIASYPPSNLNDYVAYARAVVNRYKADVHVWEVWNEPNGPLFWRPAEDPVAYANMLKATYAAIKAEDPTAIVISGGLAGFDYDFMEVLRQQGALSSFDAFGLHTFVNNAPEKSQSGTWIDSAESYLAKYAPGKKIWITELAWSTCTPGAGCDSGVTEAQQASYLSRAYLDAAARGIAGIVWWNLVEFGNTNNKLDNYGLVDRSGRAKPAYTALAKVGAALDGTTTAGVIAPTADGGSLLLSDMADSSSGSLVNLNGTTSTLSFGSGRHGGVAGASVAYNFGARGTGVRYDMNYPIVGQPTAVSVWTYGDSTNSPIYLKVTDATGESFAGLIGNSAGPVWKRMSLFLDGSNPDFTHSGGDNDGTIDFPIKVTAITIYKSTVSGQASGRVYLDDLSAHFGPITRGVIAVGNGVTTKAIYSLNSTTATIPVTGATAFLRVGKSATPLTISGGGVSVTYGQDPIFVTSAPGVSAVASRTGDAVTFTWDNGDRSDVSISVVSSTGSVVKTLRTHTLYDSGTAKVVWDGTNSGGVATGAGDYRFRLTVYSLNGRSSTVYVPITRTN
ncbi:endo-1,4-beta-xylanase [Herbiconiux ginsengi]|nr:endo-1,4-beta-xylanase [Herbiconiux ginsengi]